MKAIRCAIYTRKSSEEGLDQAFNSLHAQREACEAYVLSQAGEGWVASPEIYDDGGFSGGSMERPALVRLLAAIKAKRIDVVVVYKVDRLTRSLGDFARIVEQFDAQGVSFVSVTQAFNTTSSMGRLTLNVLLSFAQFEREVTGERIRDKIAASKKKGMWMGGTLPLGYDPPTDPTTRALVVNAVEAETVRLIFQRYLEIGSVHLLAKALTADGVVTKHMVFQSGRERGGVAFTRGALFHLLKNRLYLGEVPHNETYYPGAHTALIDRETFEAVQAMLARSRTKARAKRQPQTATAPLKGILFDADGDVMSPVANSNRHGRSYRYYVSSTVQRGQSVGARDDNSVRRISAVPLETLIRDRVERLCPGVPAFPQGVVARVDTSPTHLVISLAADQIPGWTLDPESAVERLLRRAANDERVWKDGDDRIKLAIAVSPKLSGGRTEFLTAEGQPGQLTARHDTRLIRALQTAHARLRAWRADPSVGIKHDTQYDRRLLALAFLAPDLQRAILDGRQGPRMTLSTLRATDLPLSWDAQRSLFSR
jgi:site-specific DNA recombinase